MEVLRKRLIEDLPDAIVVIDESGKILLVNEQTEKLFGYSRDELLGRVLEMLLPERFRKIHVEHRNFYFLNPQKRPMGKGLELVGLTKGGREISVDISLSPSKTAKGPVACAIIRDVSEQKSLENELQKFAYYDSVTKLTNSFYFQEELEQALTKVKSKKNTEVVIFYLNIDHFKKFNDIYGRKYGDLLLKKIGERLQQIIRRQDLLSKQNGAQFSVLIRRTHSNLRDTNKIARRLMGGFKKPFALDGAQISCTACIGISISSLSGQSSSGMIRDAETALWQAKKLGPGSFNYFSRKMRKFLLKNILIESELKNAIEKKEFRLVFQPIIDLKRDEIFGMETLLRWENGKLGEVKPGRFIPIAEKSELINVIDQWVVENACLQLLTLIKKHPKFLKNFLLTINISAVQLHNPNFKKWFINFIKKNNIPRNLVLEITETALVSDIRGAASFMGQIHEMGVSFAIDDFGAGYTSLYFLKKLPIDFLKIDKRFLQGIAEDKSTIQIIDSIIQLGKSLNIGVIAEGVSDKEHKKILNKKQCLYAQGYYFSVPLPLDELEEMYFAN